MACGGFRSVIDVWEAMSVDRPCRRAVPQAAILGYIARSSGTLFDPEVVAAFLEWRQRDGVGFRTKLAYLVESDTEKLFIL